MECKEIERLFDRYFDREISRLEYQALRGHLTRCAICRENFLNLQFSLDFLAELPQESPSDRWTAPAVDDLPWVEKMKTPYRRRIYAVAACVILAALVTVIDGQLESPGAALLISPTGGKRAFATPSHNWVLPKGAVLRGDLYVRGNVTIQGVVEGDIHIQRTKHSGLRGQEEKRTISERIMHWWKGVVIP